MKKLLLFASILFVSVACSSDDNNGSSSNNSSSKITPPAWIQGTWIDKEMYDVAGYKIGYMFKADDICILQVSTETCWKGIIDRSNSVPAPSEVNVDQTISDTEYKCSIAISSGQTVHFHFEKINSTTIRVVEGDNILTKF